MPATSSSTSGSREKILARIREALRLSAPPRHLGHHSAGPASAHGSGDQNPEQWLPPVPEDHEGRVGLFEKISADLKTGFVRVRGVAEAADFLKSLAGSENWGRIASHKHPLIDQVLAAAAFDDVLRTDGGYEKAALERCDAGVTGCEALVAQTASILVSSTSSGGRVLSVLPPHHIVIATPDQLERDLKSALDAVRRKHGGKLPRYLSFITGPSRTGDIERILVLGAHGPKKLTVLLVG